MTPLNTFVAAVRKVLSVLAEAVTSTRKSMETNTAVAELAARDWPVDLDHPIAVPEPLCELWSEQNGAESHLLELANSTAAMIFQAESQYSAAVINVLAKQGAEAKQVIEARLAADAIMRFAACEIRGLELKNVFFNGCSPLEKLLELGNVQADAALQHPYETRLEMPVRDGLRSF